LLHPQWKAAMNKPFLPSLVLKPALLVAALFAIAPIAHAEKVLMQPARSPGSRTPRCRAR
jgi:hypothetical protein